MLKKISLVLLPIFLFSCVSLDSPMPRWTEIKPANTDNEIFFVYGPGESRARAKEGLYKEISEYFGIKVSSFDKFVKVVEVQNDNRDIDQSTESRVDIKSREKGLNSIEILEIWQDRESGKWWFLASLDKKSEKTIRKQVKIDIENERVAGVLSQGEEYSKTAQLKLDEIIDNITALNRIKIELTQDVEKVNGIESQLEVMELTGESVKLGYQAEDIIKSSRALNNEIKVINKKNELLVNQLEGNEVALIELDLFIKESNDILIRSEDSEIDITDLEMDIELLKEELDKIYLEAELVVLGEEEAEKRRVYSLLTEIRDSYFSLKELSDNSKVIFNQTEDALRDLKVSVNSRSYSKEEVEAEVDESLNRLLDSLDVVKGHYKDASEYKSIIKKNYEEIKDSEHISKDDIKEMKNIIKRLESPLSWIEIYKDKVQIIINKAKKIKDDYRAMNLEEGGNKTT